jgi:DnaJ family protein A protein 3
LGLKKGASAKEIKKAYYDLAKKYHPDTNSNDKTLAKKFQDISEAYEVFFFMNKLIRKASKTFCFYLGIRG